MTARGKKVAILTKNEYLYQKLYLELCETAGAEPSCAEEADFVICDTDTEEARRGAILIGHGDGVDLSLPLPLGELSELLFGDRNAPLTLCKEERIAVTGAKKVKLTEIEFALLSLLLERGDFVSREEILEQIWKGEADSGVVNVYVHYLREKLEADGERVIISSRRGGYKISDKFLTGRGVTEE